VEPGAVVTRTALMSAPPGTAALGTEMWLDAAMPSVASGAGASDTRHWWGAGSPTADRHVHAIVRCTSRDTTVPHSRPRVDELSFTVVVSAPGPRSRGAAARDGLTEADAGTMPAPAGDSSTGSGLRACGRCRIISVWCRSTSSRYAVSAWTRTDARLGVLRYEAWPIVASNTAVVDANASIERTLDTLLVPSTGSWRPLPPGGLPVVETTTSASSLCVAESKTTMASLGELLKDSATGSAADWVKRNRQVVAIKESRAARQQKDVAAAAAAAAAQRSVAYASKDLAGLKVQVRPPAQHV
jgi:hypothetical protein